MKPLNVLEIPLQGRRLIEASAGTGKTYTITTLFLRLLLERHLRIDQILVVTFTRAATAELRARVRARIRDAIFAFDGGVADAEIRALVARSEDRAHDRALLSQALHGFDEAAIFTIHGFCQRALLDHAFESQTRFETELVSDQTPLLLQVVEDYWTRELYRATPAQVDFLRSQKVGLPALVSLAHVAIGWHDVPFETSLPAGSTDERMARFLAAREQAKATWSRARGEILELLRSEDLSRNIVPLTSISKWASQLDGLLARAEPSLDGWSEHAQRFTRSALEKAVKQGCRAPRHPFFEQMEELVEAEARARHSLEAWLLEFQQGLVHYVRSELDRRKVDAGVQSFDDLLTRLVVALGAPGGEALAEGIRSRYPAALIDEFQDTDGTQYGIFSRVWSGAETTLLLIGDPKQAIYAFRGADVFSYLAAARDAGSERYTLTTSYRSDPGLVRAVNAVFSRPERPFELPGIDYHPVQARPGAKDELASERAPLEVAFVRRKDESKRIPKGDAEMSERVASDVCQLLEEAPPIAGRALTPDNIAILTRSNKEAQALQRALAERQVPSVLLGDKSVLSTPEAEELTFILQALARPTSQAALSAALVTAPFGVRALELLAMEEDEAAWELHVERFLAWHARWESSGFLLAFRSLLAESGATRRLLALVDGERRLTNYLHLSELVHRAAIEQHLGIAGVLRFWDDVRFDSGRFDMAPDAQQIRLERDDAAVKLTTMHKSKGLEYEVVYCPYLWDGAALKGRDRDILHYHDPDRGMVLRLTHERGKRLEADEHYQLAHREAFAESLRLAYVALTRAKRHCVAVFGAFNGAGDSPLGHLLLAGDASASPAQLVEHGSDGSLLGRIRELGAASDGAVGCRELSPITDRQYRNRRSTPRAFAARVPQRLFDLGHRRSSFSALVARSHDELSVLAEVGRDVDEGTAQDRAGQLAEAATPVPLAAFPRGARPGELLHAIFEHSNFGDPDSIAAVSRDKLEAYGYPPMPDLAAALEAVMRTPLSDAGPRLEQIRVDRRLDELEFSLPVRERGRELSAARLGRVLTEHGRPPLPKDTGARISQLGFAPLSGFLRGFIDMVFEYDGRFWLVDYKSNHLGDHLDDYTPDRLSTAMAHHHYFLQYHLYVVALHRYLATRIADYEYDRHFGGVYYLFLRGMTPASGHRRGVYFDRPSEALVQALSKELS